LETANGGPRPLVVIANDDAEQQAELTRLLEDAGFLTIAATSGEEALALAQSESPAVVILDVALAGKSGYEVCRALREEFGEEFPIVFVSATRIEPYDRVAGLIVGADDYVVKPYVPDELVARIRRHTIRGQERSQRVGAASRLTARELEVLRLIADGSSTQEIARQLFISPQTVRTHIEHVLSKLQVNSRVGAVAVAYKEGLIEREA
jgi:DNA-binding NarL/FixJ family response regulator